MHAPSLLQRAYGWRPQLPDARDLVLEVDETAKLPTVVDLRSTGHLSPVYDQGQLGSCTANSIAGVLDYVNHLEHGHWDYPSRLWIYYQERLREGTVETDAGAAIRDGIQVVHQLGAPPETDWPYDVTKFAVHPPTKAGKDARLDVAITYRAPAQTLSGLRGALAAKLPVVFGFTVYQSFESAQVAATGVVPMPGRHESTLGGHAVALAGYDDTTERFLVRNSWGANWGQAGYFTMPYAYVTSRTLASDFWTISKST